MSRSPTEVLTEMNLNARKSLRMYCDHVVKLLCERALYQLPPEYPIEMTLDWQAAELIDELSKSLPDYKEIKE